MKRHALKDKLLQSNLNRTITSCSNPYIATALWPEQNDLQQHPTGFYIQNKKSIRTWASKYFNCPAVEFSWTNIFIFRLDESLHWYWKRLNRVCVASTSAVDVWAQRPVFLFSYKYETTLVIKYVCACSPQIIQVKVWIVYLIDHNGVLTLWLL